MRLTFDALRDGLSAVNAAAERMAYAQWQVATGRRLRGASDDPSAARRIIDTRADLGRMDSYARTADSATARLATLDTYVGDMVDQLTHALTLAQGAQGSLQSQEVRDAAAAALRGVRDAVATDINATFQGISLFSGTRSDQQAYLQVAGVWTYQGNADAANVQIDDNRSVMMTMDGQAILQGADASDILTVLEDLATAASAGDAAGMATGMDALRRGFDRAVQAQAEVGVDQRLVSDQYANLGRRRLDLTERLSKDHDANLADAVTRMSEGQQAYQAALGALAYTQQPSLFDYLS